MTAKQTKILFVVTEDWYFISHRLSLACAARDAGLKVSVATAPGQFRHVIEKEGLNFYPLLLRRKNKTPMGEIFSIAQMASLYRRLSPDLIHHVALKPVLYGSLAARAVAAPSVVNAITGLGYAFVNGGPHKRLLRKVMELGLMFSILHRNSTMLFQNPDDQNLFIQKGIIKRSQARLIAGAGVDTRRFIPSPEPPSHPTILLPARMLWDKGIGELVQAARILKERSVDFRVLLAGRLDPCNAASIPEQQLKEWEQEGLVQWLGNVDDMPSLFARCHIVCLPSSYREGIPLALIEGAASGRPIVTTDMPGCREIVRHGHNGLLVPVASVRLLVEALHTLIADSEMRREMGQRGRALVIEQFSKEIIVGKTLDLYQELLGNKWPSQRQSS
jgi:glycosyltransferase involved in cell wall biosynthesis